MNENDIKRFWSKVQKGAPDECWLWLAGRSQVGGYGQFWLDGKNVVASRVAYALVNGSLTDDDFVCHHCDNPPCCNPAHLFKGTVQDNSDDMVRKDRQCKGLYHRIVHFASLARGDRNGARKYPERLTRGDKHWMRQRPQDIMRGEGHGRAVLTEAQVLEIRASSLSQKKMADMYGVTKTLIRKIQKREIWKHI